MQILLFSMPGREKSIQAFNRLIRWDEILFAGFRSEHSRICAFDQYGIHTGYK